MEHGIACASFYARLVHRGYGVLIDDPPTQHSFMLACKKKKSWESPRRYVRISIVSPRADALRYLPRNYTRHSRIQRDVIAEKRCNRGGHYIRLRFKSDSAFKRNDIWPSIGGTLGSVEMWNDIQLERRLWNSVVNRASLRRDGFERRLYQRNATN